MGGEHQKQDDEDKYKGNGYDPNRSIPDQDPGGKHTKQDEEE